MADNYIGNPPVLPLVGVFTFGALKKYVANSTWTKPAGLKRVRVTVVGGGGSGGGASATAGGQCSIGGGGASGGWSIKVIEAASLGATEAVTVGAGGIPANPVSNPGGVGGTSSFGAHCSATGGDYGIASSPNPAGWALAGRVPGVGSGGDINCTGAPGIPGSYSVGVWINGMVGGNGPFGGAGPCCPSSSNAAGAPAVANSGSGGGGAANDASQVARIGGTGGSGIVIVEEFF